MHNLLVLLALFALVAAACTNEQLIRCVLRQADENNDKVLSVGEIDAWMKNTKCFNFATAGISAHSVMNACDVNKNGQLDREDVLDRKSCLRFNDLHDLVCQMCGACAIVKNTQL